MDIRDKAALITGGKRIGLLIAEELARHGANVALSYGRSRDEAEDGATRVRAIGRQAAAIQADLSSPDGCRAAVTGAADAPVDI
jgi:NAD(P)-dependent dehydrogenase (short-subunit alcohol dehydrogenase family)